MSRPPQQLLLGIETEYGFSAWPEDGRRSGPCRSDLLQELVLLARDRLEVLPANRGQGLYLANGLVLLAVMALYVLLAPGAGATGPSLWLALVTGQAYLLARLASKLLFYTTEIAYFQSQLAHAGYVAAPAPVWPESPTAEALGRLG